MTGPRTVNELGGPVIPGRLIAPLFANLINRANNNVRVMERC